MGSRDRSLPVLSIICSIFAIPCLFFTGLIVGLAAPAVAIAGIVAGVRLLTGRVPFLNLIREDQDEDEEEKRYLSFTLVPPDEARGLFAQQKEQIGGEFATLRAEIKGIIEQAQTDAGEVGAEVESGGEAPQEAAAEA